MNKHERKWIEGPFGQSHLVLVENGKITARCGAVLRGEKKLTDQPTAQPCQKCLQREHPEQFEKGESPWQKAAQKPPGASTREIEFQPSGSEKEIPVESNQQARKLRQFPKHKIE